VQHRVQITQAFYAQTTEVTQGQYTALMGTNPSHFSSCGRTCPVEEVSWFEALKYANALSKKEGLPPCYALSGKRVTVKARAGNPLNCTGYRLPTEAEWEYAARAGTTGARYGKLDAVAWYWDNAGRKTHPVAKKQPNAWGLYDMLGNVNEWTSNRYGNYSASSATNPIGARKGTYRVFRGGGWSNYAHSTRAADRSGLNPSSPDLSTGFRLFRSAP
jgi:formylglycine-generating enzyme required for sulfatase activity